MKRIEMEHIGYVPHVHSRGRIPVPCAVSC